MNCKFINDCKIVKQIEKWEKEEGLEIENTGASWIVGDMFCKQFIVKEIDVI